MRPSILPFAGRLQAWGDTAVAVAVAVAVAIAVAAGVVEDSLASAAITSCPAPRA